jgi:peptide/nickel transport system substrate-binding protein
MPTRTIAALRLITRTSLATAAVLSASAGGAMSQAAPAPVHGGNLTMLAGSDVDFLDPGRTYFSFGQMVTLATNRPLYSFRPDDAQHPVPDLAAAPPQVSPDLKTVTVALRPGIRYAPPVNREATSADVKYAFERFFSENVYGLYPAYFSTIKGAPADLTHGVRPISGIATPDPHTIVFTLKQPAGVSFAASLVMPITVPVPAEYAKPFDAHDPSTYNTHVAFTGPYMVRNSASGALTGYRPGKSIELVRNPNWVAATDYRPAYLDAILIRTDQYDGDAAALQVVAGRNLVFDTNPPAGTLRQLRATSPSLLSTVPAGGFRYFSMNTQVKPFNNINVRKAVMAGFDRVAARRARGGEQAGDLATHFLPPDFPGFAEAGGYAGFPDVDYFNQGNQTGNRALAAKYLKKAGFRSGRYTGKRRLLLVGTNVDPGKALIENAASQLRKLGFKTRVRLVSQDSVYGDWCQVRSKKIAMCAAGWFKDFADPQSMLEPVFRGSLISRRGLNTNISLFDDPKVDAAMDVAARATGDDRLRRWGAIDKMLIRDAAGIPYLWDKTTLVRAPNVLSLPNPYVTTWDLSFTSLLP